MDGNARYKIYRDHVDIAVFSRPIFTAEPQTRPHEIKRGRAGEKRREDSLTRSKQKVHDIIAANGWDWWATVTFDPGKIDRLDHAACKRAFQNWITNLAARQGIKYLAVAERHKRLFVINGEIRQAIHFHVLIGGNPGGLIPSGRTDKHGHVIYNLEGWRYGHSTAVHTYGAPGNIVKYLTKYLTKDTLSVTGKSYWSGGAGLAREVPTVYGLEDYEKAAGREVTIENGEFKLGIKYRREGA